MTMEIGNLAELCVLTDMSALKFGHSDKNDAAVGFVVTVENNLAKGVNAKLPCGYAR